MIHFVLGGARSGKSRFAEQKVTELCQCHHKTAVYVATATKIDDEMTRRIAKHQYDRADHWQLVESPLCLADTIRALEDGNVYLIDCLTLWLNNQLFSVDGQSRNEQEAHILYEVDKLVDALERLLSKRDVNIVIVSNEVGLGVIPMGKETRLFVDYCGWLNQKIAAISDEVTLVTAGIPLVIKHSQGRG